MNLTNIVVSLSLAIYDVMLINYYLKNTFKRKDVNNKWIFIVEIFVFFLINSRILPVYINLILLIIILFIAFYSFAINFKNQLKLIVSIITLTLCIENILIIFFGWLFDISITLNKEVILSPYTTLTKFISKYIFQICIVWWIGAQQKSKEEIRYFKWISLVISIYFSLTVILLDKALFYFSSVGRTFVFIVIVYNFALIMFDRYQRKAEATEKEFIITKQRIEDDKKYLIKTEAAHDEMRAFRHDLTNKLSIISSHIQRDEKDIALKHLEEMGVTIASNKAKIYIGDPSVDSIIDARVDDMLSKGITFEESYGLICIGRIDSYDLALLFALALDNAIEAVERITEGERRISLDIHTQREFLYINIENTFISKGKNDFTRTSKKTNIESHGFGVKKMKSLVNKYDGLMDYHFNGNSVMLKIVLNNNYIKENV